MLLLVSKPLRHSYVRKVWRLLVMLLCRFALNVVVRNTKDSPTNRNFAKRPSKPHYVEQHVRRNKHR